MWLFFLTLSELKTTTHHRWASMDESCVSVTESFKRWVATTSLVAESNTQQRWHEKKKCEDKTDLEIESSNGAHCEPWERRSHAVFSLDPNMNVVEEREEKLFMTLQLTYMTDVITKFKQACCHFHSIYNLVSILWDIRQFIQRKNIKA